MSTNNSSSAGASLGQKVRGAFQSVHGMGESIRGNAMDFVDSATGSEQAGHGAAVRGQQETANGVASMESRGAPQSATGQSVTGQNAAAQNVTGQNAVGAGQGVNGPTPTATSSAPAPVAALPSEKSGSTGVGA